MRPTPAALQRCNPSTPQRLNVSVTNRQRTRAVDSGLLRRIVTVLLAELLKVRQADLAVHLVAAAEITRLNVTFLRHTGPTDVITFDHSAQATQGTACSPRSLSAASSPGQLLDGQRAGLHGEIFICVEEAVDQARRFHTTWQSEVVRYIIHGILHLLGHDDSKPVAREKMKREENRLLRRISSQSALHKL
jgi:probable rRNA maturation factor